MNDQARKAVFEKLEKIVDIASLSKEEREKYDESIKVYRDQLATLAFAEQKGRLEGLQKGREEERQKGEQKLQEIARNLKAKGLPVDVIAETTGLPIEEIEKL